jgi:hypothetical protein
MTKKSRQNFDQGTSASEQEGPGAFYPYPPVDVVHSEREYVGLGSLEYNTRRQPHMGDDLEEMARNASVLNQGQHEHTIAVLRGMPGKAVGPDGTPRTSGKIKAIHQFGLGPAVAQPGPQGHDPITDPPTDYIRRPEGLDRYVGARDVLRQGDCGPSFPREHERSQFQTQTMGEDILAGFEATTAQIARSYTPPAGPTRLPSNREGQQL